ncbi:hypothetical protein DFH09DRAFT_1286044 [Mycena vulgaris]|nr:hypothetical protein DFH09DRAFT_1286044 [Mycena vulgaris]
MTRTTERTGEACDEVGRDEEAMVLQDLGLLRSEGGGDGEGGALDLGIIPRVKGTRALRLGRWFRVGAAERERLRYDGARGRAEERRRRRRGGGAKGDCGCGCGANGEGFCCSEEEEEGRKEFVGRKEEGRSGFTGAAVGAAVRAENIWGERGERRRDEERGEALSGPRVQILSDVMRAEETSKSLDWGPLMQEIVRLMQVSALLAAVVEKDIEEGEKVDHAHVRL